MGDSIVKDRISQYLNYKGISDYRFEKDLGVSKGYWNKAKNPSSDILVKIRGIYTDLSAEWLLSGEGAMLKDEAEAKGAVIPLANSKSSEKMLPMSVFNLYDIDISAGLTRLFAEDGDRRKAYLGQISIPNMPKCDGAVKVIGDSMYPLLKSGDIIAYREIHNIEAIQWGEIYILQLEYDSDISVVVKYVKKSELGSDHVLLVSYNKEHDPKDIEIKNITAIARVILCIRQLSII